MGFGVGGGGVGVGETEGQRLLIDIPTVAEIV